MRFWRVPLDAHEVQIPRGEIHLIVDRCKGCAFCVEFCPREVLAMSDAFNAKGYHYPEVVQPDNCVDCDLCEVICPDFAIFCRPAEAAAEAVPQQENPDLRLVTRDPDINHQGDHDQAGGEVKHGAR
jgi:2-oxoglutarate ferredoxin oxidoreductase subunit delta